MSDSTFNKARSRSANRANTVAVNTSPPTCTAIEPFAVSVSFVSTQPSLETTVPSAAGLPSMSTATVDPAVFATTGCSAFMDDAKNSSGPAENPNSISLPNSSGPIREANSCRRFVNCSTPPICSTNSGVNSS